MMRFLPLAFALYAAAGTAAAGELGDARAAFDAGPHFKVVQLRFDGGGVRSLHLAGASLFERRVVLTQTTEPQVIDTIPMEPEPTTTPPPPQPARGGSYFGKMTGVQWLGIGLAVLAVGAIVAGGSGGGGSDPVVNQTGGS